MIATVRQTEPPISKGQVDMRPKCWRCGRTLAEYLSRPWSLRCHRCHATNKSGPQ